MNRISVNFITIFSMFLYSNQLQAQKPNIFFSFQNLTINRHNFVMIYQLYVYEASTLPFDLETRVDIQIYLLNFYSLRTGVFYCSKLEFKLKNKNISITSESLKKSSENYDFQTVWKFKIKSVFANILKCSGIQNEFMNGKFKITNFTYFEHFSYDFVKFSENFSAYSQIDAYFTICRDKKTDFEILCEDFDGEICKRNDKFFILIFLLISLLIIAPYLVKILAMKVDRFMTYSTRVYYLS